MRSFASLRRPARRLLPATLLLAACTKTDTPTPTPAADTGRVMFVHAAPAASAQLTAFLNDVQVSQLTYGQNSAYLSVAAGNPLVRINNGTQVAVNAQALLVAKDKAYSVFEYSPTATPGSLAIVSVSDEVSTPSTGQCQVRVVNLNTGGPTPVRLTLPALTQGAPGTDLTPDVAFGSASAFVPLNAGVYNLSISANGTPRAQVLAVGDGSGSGTGVYKYLEGRVYTIVVRGISGSGVPAAQQPQAAILANN